jgi:outer membrane protein assembly factor BamA
MRSYWLFLALAAALAPAVAQGPVVRDVAFRGFEHVTPADVLKAIGPYLIIRDANAASPVGTMLLPETGRAWTDNDTAVLRRALASYPTFAKSDVVVEPVLGGVRLVIKVDENPVVLDVSILGVAIPADAQKAIPLLMQRHIGRVLNPTDIAVLAQDLTALGLPALTPALEPVQGGVRVVFGTPRTPGLVEKVTFKGVTLLTEAELQQATAAIFPGKVAAADDLRKAARAIVRLYMDKSYSLALVSGVEVTPEGAAQFSIMEPRIAEVRFEGIVKTPPDKVAALFSLKAGDLLHDPTADACVKALRDSGLFLDVAYAPRILPGGVMQLVVRVREK